MKFDWKRFCDEYGIPYVSRGAHTTSGNISIRCPWCAQADSSEHLGLKLDIHDPAYHCWRNEQHAGRNPRRLVQKLLACTFVSAQSIVNNQLVASPEQEELDRATAAMKTTTTGDQTPTTEPVVMQLLPEFRPLSQNGTPPSRYAIRFMNYLADERGFGADADAVAQMFNLHYALTGEFAWRMIIPFYAEQKLIGWTGRDIRHGAWLRYNTRGTKGMIFNADAVTEGTLIIVEGPMDAIKLHFYGHDHGFVAVATLGTAITPEQKPLLAQIIQHCERAVVLLDRDTLVAGLPLAEELHVLSGRPVRCHYLSDYEDPGKIPPKDVIHVCEAATAF